MTRALNLTSKGLAVRFNEIGNRGEEIFRYHITPKPFWSERTTPVAWCFLLVIYPNAYKTRFRPRADLTQLHVTLPSVMLRLKIVYDNPQ